MPKDELPPSSTSFINSTKLKIRIMIKITKIMDEPGVWSCRKDSFIKVRVDHILILLSAPNINIQKQKIAR